MTTYQLLNPSDRQKVAAVTETARQRYRTNPQLTVAQHWRNIASEQGLRITLEPSGGPRPVTDDEIRQVTEALSAVKGHLAQGFSEAEASAYNRQYAPPKSDAVRPGQPSAADIDAYNRMVNEEHAPSRKRLAAVKAAEDVLAETVQLYAEEMDMTVSEATVALSEADNEAGDIFRVLYRQAQDKRREAFSEHD